MYYLLYISILSQLFSGVASGYVWYLRSLQLIVHLPMMSTILPANVQAYFESLIPTVQFDLMEIIEPLSPTNYVEFDIPKHKNLEWKLLDQLEDMGYETHNTVLNLGSVWFFGAFLVARFACYLILVLVKKISKGRL